MAHQMSTSLRNARLNVIETHIGTAPKVQIRTGSPPANCAAAASGSLLAEVTCPSDWLEDASGGSKVLKGTWQILASGSGTAGHYRVLDSAGTTCHLQGTCTLTGGDGDMTLDNTNLQSGQQFTVTAFTLNEGNA